MDPSRSPSLLHMGETTDEIPEPPPRRDRPDIGAAYACGIYLKRAQAIDKGLIEGWKGDMDGILIFSGLFSAVVTATLVESYKLLQVDNEAITVKLLARTVAALEHVPLSSVDAPEDTNPSVTISLFINAAWFLSLVLSLSCALLATLIQQWARTYSQAVGEEKPISKLQQARRRVHAAEGVERFGVSTIVACIPALLHAALFLFFAGLVAFLFTVHSTLAFIVVGLLSIIAMAYAALTLLPLFVRDCPYRTPVTYLVIYLLHHLFPASRYLGRPESSSTESVDLQLSGKILATVIDSLTNERTLTNENITRVFNAIPAMTGNAHRPKFTISMTSFLRSVLFSENNLLDDLPRILHTSTEHLLSIFTAPYFTTQNALAELQEKIKKEAAPAEPCFRLLTLLAGMCIQEHTQQASSRVNDTVDTIIQRAVYPCIEPAVALLRHRTFLQSRGDKHIVLPTSTARAACDCLVVLTWLTLLKFHETFSILTYKLSIRDKTGPTDIKMWSSEPKNLTMLTRMLRTLLASFGAVIMAPDLSLPPSSSLLKLLEELETVVSYTEEDAVSTLLRPPLDSAPESRAQKITRIEHALSDIYLVVAARLAIKRQTGVGEPIYTSPDITSALDFRSIGHFSAADEEIYAREMLDMLLRPHINGKGDTGLYGSSIDDIIGRYLRLRRS